MHYLSRKDSEKIKVMLFFFSGVQQFSAMENDIVAKWSIPMSDKLYNIEFEHGTTTGKRIVRVNGKVIQ